MPNGRPGDHPITDMLMYGAHPFPADMEEMIRRLNAKDRKLIDKITVEDVFHWERGDRLEAGRKKLRNLCRKHGVAVPRSKKT